MNPRWSWLSSARGGALTSATTGRAREVFDRGRSGEAAALRALWGRVGKHAWRPAVVSLVVYATVMAATAVAVAGGLNYLYRDRSNLPDLGPFTRFELSSIGRVYDVHNRPLIELAREHRLITPYADIPPIVRDAVLAAEDKRFFAHDGVDYLSVPRVLGRVRMGTLAARLLRGARHDEANGPIVFPQGGSTITQQVVRGYFLKDLTAHQNSGQLRSRGLASRALSHVIGARSVNMLARKVEEMRLSLWVERRMRERFGSKRRAKEEILARYASLIYVGNGQYGLAKAAEYYFGRSLATFTIDDADKAALLAGIAKSPRDYAPTASDPEKVLRRRNRTLALMAANGFITRDLLRDAERRPLPAAARRERPPLQAPAVVGHVLEEIAGYDAHLSVEDLLQGRIQVYSTVDGRLQQMANEALEHGLGRYETRHPRAKGLIQGSIVVLRNGDASILAETGGRQFYKGRSASYSDFNRVTSALRQPGSAMKPMVYLAAFRQGTFDLTTIVPDEPIGVPEGGPGGTKWIANYDRQFKGSIPLREALAESRNTVAIWIATQIGIDRVLQTSRSLGVQTPLQPHPATALGASEVNLLELANAYRTMASGIRAEPYVIRRIVRDSGEVVVDPEPPEPPIDVSDAALSLIQEGLRGVVRMPTGTAHVLHSRGFPIAVMGKTGTTNEFKDALFVGSTYGPDGITIAVRIGFDDNRSLGSRETGGRAALPVFQEIMLRVYGDQIVGPAPAFPAAMERRIDRYLEGSSPEAITAASAR